LCCIAFGGGGKLEALPRRPREATGGLVYHVLNRGVGRMTVFESDGDYAAFLRTVDEVQRRVPTRVMAYCLMPNHWHLVLWPEADGQLSEFLRLLTVTRTQRWHAFHKTSGTGALYQGRFKSFPVQDGGKLFSACRYVERNALRAGLTASHDRSANGSNI
jgi:putative transposase